MWPVSGTAGLKGVHNWKSPFQTFIVCYISELLLVESPFFFSKWSISLYHFHINNLPVEVVKDTFARSKKTFTSNFYTFNMGVNHSGEHRQQQFFTNKTIKLPELLLIIHVQICHHHKNASHYTKQAWVWFSRSCDE